MSFAGVRNALDQYSRNAVQTGVESASPHRLIQMLMEGALGKIAAAKGLMERGEIQAKGEQIGSAISIIDGLKASLDKEKGGDIARNLEDLYIYMERRLLEAHSQNDVSILDEVMDLLKELKEAWDAIGEQVKHEPAA
ncbi:MAG TPA: flagellar export chaperone FliS [Gammaproteobacteria bacterium]|nr:flagellar export chaperone FliS [Gammaproteobacteria bacterium]